MTAHNAHHGQTGLMVDEAHHRFSNGLQLILSTTNGIMRDVRDPHISDRLRALQDRVALLADVNRLLSGPYDLESVSKDTLVRLCSALAASSDRAGTRVVVTARGEVRCAERRRTLLLLVGELMTNALKHGGRGRRLCVRVTLIATDERCCLKVCSDVADRLTAARPRMATALAEAAGGTLDSVVDAGRFRVSVVLPSR